MSAKNLDSHNRWRNKTVWLIAQHWLSLCMMAARLEGQQRQSDMRVKVSVTCEKSICKPGPHLFVRLSCYIRQNVVY